MRGGVEAGATSRSHSQGGLRPGSSVSPFVPNRSRTWKSGCQNANESNRFSPARLRALGIGGAKFGSDARLRVTTHALAAAAATRTTGRRVDICEPGGYESLSPPAGGAERAWWIARVTPMWKCCLTTQVAGHSR